MKYRREVDGLRAIAVVPVILFHAGFTAFGGGYIGVDVFFVISGYLITTILITDREAGRYSLWRFYERRARRILPALFVVLACTIPFAWLWIPPVALEDYARSLAFSVMFISNLHFIEHSGYFDVQSELRPLLHTWSLAVEEQYYIVFPAFLWALGRFVRARHIAAFIAVAAGSLALAVWGASQFPAENFFFTPSRLWELLAGSICAALLLNRAQMRHEGLAALGLVLILGSVLWLRPGDPSPSLYTTAPVLGAMFVILFASGDTMTGRLLSAPPLVAIGLISYSLYLWHQPVFALSRIRGWEEALPGMIWLLIALSMVLATITWALIERPFRTRVWLRERKAVFGASLGGSVMLGAIGFSLVAWEGVPQRLEGKDQQAFHKLITADRAVNLSGMCADGPRPVSDKLCRAYGPETAASTIAVLGDSHAAAILPAFEQITEGRSLRVMQGIHPACPPLLGVYLVKGGAASRKCHDLVKGFAADTVAQGVDTVFIAARWSLYVKGDLTRKSDPFLLSIDPAMPRMSDADYFASFKAGLINTITYFEEAGLRVVLMDQVPQQVRLPETVIAQAILRGLSKDDIQVEITNSFITIEKHEALVRVSRDILMEVARALGAEVMSVNAFFERDGRYAWMIDDKLLYFDADHISPAAARALSPRLEKVLQVD
ncbi:acyltransferase [Roseovarius sp. A21]|uniref:Acyltransferase n=1 Tax=Roseovarius bejariae TaxID=2576383 RepID=A0A844CV92_9RHOB|nr:acyltransferase family protein [Roseovarius bejariae]MRU14600.1 acyltransferase [Roseovarius bejariae]